MVEKSKEGTATRERAVGMLRNVFGPSAPLSLEHLWFFCGIDETQRNWEGNTVGTVEVDQPQRHV